MINWLFIYLRWLSGKEFACPPRRCRRHRFDPWVRKIPWRRKLQPIPMFLPVKFHGQRNQTGYSLGMSKRVGCDWVTEDAHSYWVGLVLRLQLQCYCGRKIFFLETSFLLLELNRVAEALSHYWGKSHIYKIPFQLYSIWWNNKPSQLVKHITGSK